MVKFIFMIPKQDGVSRQDFMYRWRDVCVPAVKKLEGLKRYVINPAIEAGDEPKYLGVAEMSFETAEAGMTAFESDQGKEIMADLATFADMDNLVMCATEEKVIIP